MTRRLGPLERDVLSALENSAWDSPPTPYEIGRYIHRYGDWRPATDTERVAGALARMARRGLTERVGVAFSGARTWRITPAGRAALMDDGQGGAA